MLEQLRFTSDESFVLTYPSLIPCPVLTQQHCSLCSGDMGQLRNKWECALSITLPCFISDQVPLFPRSGIKLMDGSISWQARVTSPAHSSFPGVLRLCPSWLYRIFFPFFVCMCVPCGVFLLQNVFANAGKKRGGIFAMCPLHQQSSGQQPSWQLSQAKHFLHILLASRALPVSTHTHTHARAPSFWKQTHILLNKGLTTALHLAVLVQCLILRLIPLELLSLWLHFFS